MKQILMETIRLVCKLIILASAVLFWVGFFLYFTAIDDSDADRFHRSGMVVYTDHLTGLQYLGGSSGGITPRLDAEGRHIMAKGEVK